MKIHGRLRICPALAVFVFLGACSSTPVAPPVAVTPSPPAPVIQPAPAPVAAAPQPAAPAVIASTPIAPYLDPQNVLYKERSLYFDFDQALVKPEYSGLVELHGKYLASHPAVAIRIEGNTDEQGGAEYNLALGQKRAEAVVKSLSIYGVKESQMEAVSFGKEKPKVVGHDETAYAQNRRADLVYPVK